MTLAQFFEITRTSKADFAAKIGVTPVSLSRYLSGDRIPHRKQMALIREHTQGAVTADDFFLAKQEERAA